MNTKERSKRNAFLGAGRAGSGLYRQGLALSSVLARLRRASHLAAFENCALGGGQRIRFIGICEVGKGFVLPLHQRHSIQELLELFGRQRRANARESARYLTTRGSQGFALSGIIRQEELSSIRKRAVPTQDSSPIGQSSRRGDKLVLHMISDSRYSLGSRSNRASLFDQRWV